MTNKLESNEIVTHIKIQPSSLGEIIKDFNDLKEKCDNVIIKIKKRKSKKKEKVAAAEK